MVANPQPLPIGQRHHFHGPAARGAVAVGHGFILPQVSAVARQRVAFVLQDHRGGLVQAAGLRWLRGAEGRWGNNRYQQAQTIAA